MVKSAFRGESKTRWQRKKEAASLAKVLCLGTRIKEEEKMKSNCRGKEPRR